MCRSIIPWKEIRESYKLFTRKCLKEEEMSITKKGSCLQKQKMDMFELGKWNKRKNSFKDPNGQRAKKLQEAIRKGTWEESKVYKELVKSSKLHIVQVRYLRSNKCQYRCVRFLVGTFLFQI